MSSGRGVRRIGSGTVLALGIVGVAGALLVLGQVVGWDPTWRALGVTPLQPPFFDMHVINDYAACARKESMRMRCMRATRTTSIFRRPGCGSAFSGSMGRTRPGFQRVTIAAAAIVMVLLVRGRPWYHGLIALPL